MHTRLQCYAHFSMTHCSDTSMTSQVYSPMTPPLLLILNLVLVSFLVLEERPSANPKAQVPTHPVRPRPSNPNEGTSATQGTKGHRSLRTFCRGCCIFSCLEGR